MNFYKFFERTLKVCTCIIMFIFKYIFYPFMGATSKTNRKIRTFRTCFIFQWICGIEVSVKNFLIYGLNSSF